MAETNTTLESNYPPTLEKKKNLPGSYVQLATKCCQAQKDTEKRREVFDDLGDSYLFLALKMT